MSHAAPPYCLLLVVTDAESEASVPFFSVGAKCCTALNYMCVGYDELAPGQ